MDKTSDEPPTSAVLLDNCHFSQVIFNNVQKFYVPGGDVTCQYTLTQNMVPRGKDWVGIFRVSESRETPCARHKKAAVGEMNSSASALCFILRQDLGL